MENTSWHLRKEINVGHLLTTILLVSGLVVWGIGIDTRISKAEVRIETIIALMAENRVDQRNMRDEMMLELRYIRERIDRISEGGNK